MPRIDKSVLKGQGGSFNIGSERTVAEEVLQVAVFQSDDGELFAGFVSDVYDAIASQYQTAYATNAPLPFTREELVKYAFTGMRARLARVNNEGGVRVNGERWQIRCDDPWQMPAILAAVLNSIGRVQVEDPVITIYPIWDERFDAQVLDRAAWIRITQLIRGVASSPAMKLIVVNQLAGDRSGDEMVLTLIPVRDEVGRIVRFGHRNQPVDAIAAAVYYIAGFAPSIYAGVTTAQHPMLLPPYFITVGALRQNLWRLTEAA